MNQYPSDIPEGTIAFIIWTVVALIFLCIGIYDWNQKKEVGFFQHTKPKKMKDVKAYNHAVAKIWFVFAIVFELLGIPLCGAEQNSAVAVIPILGVVFLVIFIVVAYTMVEAKYKDE